MKPLAVIFQQKKRKNFFEILCITTDNSSSDVRGFSAISQLFQLRFFSRRDLSTQRDPTVPTIPILFNKNEKNFLND